MLLTDDVNRDLRSEDFGRRGDQNDLSWKGDNEFERAASKKAFFDRYAPLIRQVAPKAPFPVHLFQNARPSPSTPPERASLLPIVQALGESLGDKHCRRLLARGGLRADLQFSWPEIFWPVEASSAPKVLQDLVRLKT